MQFRLYQMNVAAGSACAVLLGALRHGASSNSDTPLLQALEATSFGLCIIGVMTGGRSLRARYTDLGFSKAVAASDATYMGDRRNLQVSAIVATAAVASLVASRYGVDPLYAGLSVLGVVAMAVLLINRMAGWKSKS